METEPLYQILNINLYKNDSSILTDIQSVSTDTGSSVGFYSSINPNSLASGSIVGDIEYAGGTLSSTNFVSGVSGWQLSPESAEFNVGVAVESLDIPDTTTANSMHIESDGNTFWGCNNADFTSDNDNALSYVLKTGVAKFQSISIGGTTTQYQVNDDGIFSYGDGSDGALSTSGDVTLTSDKYYTNLTINTGHTFYPAGYRIFVNGTLTLVGTGKISRNGVAGGNGSNGSGATGGTAGTAGAAIADGYLKGSVAGKAGGAGGNGSDPAGVGVAGTAGTATTNSIGASGVSGGSGGSGGHGDTVGGGAGGAAGGSGSATASNVKLIANWHLATLLDVSSTGATVKYDNSAGSGSAGGGGGGGQGVGINNNPGGGGGGGGSASSGGIIAIYAKNIIIGASSIIEANGGNGGNGGNGANATSTGTGAGGGGGGAGGGGGDGGQIVLVYNELSNDGSITVTAGVGGTGGTGGTVSGGNSGAGSNGANGTNGIVGTIRQFNLSL